MLSCLHIKRDFLHAPWRDRRSIGCRGLLMLALRIVEHHAENCDLNHVLGDGRPPVTSKRFSQFDFTIEKRSKTLRHRNARKISSVALEKILGITRHDSIHFVTQFVTARRTKPHTVKGL